MSEEKPKWATASQAGKISILQEIRKRTKDIFDEYGLDGQLGNITYDDTGFEAKKFQVHSRTEQGEKTDARDRRSFEQHAPSYELKASDFGNYFLLKNELYQIVGWKPSARKYKVRCNNLDSKEAKVVTPAAVKTALQSRQAVLLNEGFSIFFVRSLDHVKLNFLFDDEDAKELRDPSLITSVEEVQMLIDEKQNKQKKIDEKKSRRL